MIANASQLQHRLNLIHGSQATAMLLLFISMQSLEEVSLPLLIITFIYVVANIFGFDQNPINQHKGQKPFEAGVLE